MSSESEAPAGSEYEDLFQVQHRQPGRPAGRGSDVVFKTADKEHQDLAIRARQRAIAVVMEENRERLRSLFNSEYEWLVYLRDTKRGRL